MPRSLQVTCWSPDVWGSVIATFLMWDCKDDDSAESSEGNPVLPAPCKGNGIRGTLSTDPKENTHSYLTRTAKRSINSPTNESNFFQKDIQPHLKKHKPWQFPSRTSQQTAPVFLPRSQLRNGVLSQGWICQTSNSSHWVSLCFCQPAWKAATGVFQLALFSNVWFLILSPAMHELFFILTWRSIKCTFLTFIHKLPWRHQQLRTVEDCKFRLGLDEAEGDSPGKIQGKTTTDF